MSEPENEPETEPDIRSETEPGRKRTVPIVVGAVVVLVVVGVVVYLLTRPADSEQSADQDTPPITGEAPDTSPPTSPSVSNPATGAATSEVPGKPPNEEQVAAARTVAEDALDAVNTQDFTAIAEIACDPDSVGQPGDLAPGVDARIVGEPQIDGDTATVPMEVRLDGVEEPIIVDLPLEKRQDGSWCVP